MAQRSTPERPARTDTARAKRAAFIAAGVIVAAIGLVVVLDLDGDAPEPGSDTGADMIIDLVPEPLAKDDVRTGGIDPAAGGTMPELEAGGWIQIVDKETGRLAQQYRFARLDPTPEGMGANWVSMDQPRAELYLADNRVIRLSGDSALVHLPHRVLESGSLTGHVLIEVFEPPPGRLLDLDRDKPMLVVHAPEAAFDNVMGEVTCPERFRVETPSLEFLGSGLSLLINDQVDPVRTTMEVEQLEFVRFAQGAIGTAPRDRTDAPQQDDARRTAAAPGSPAAAPGPPAAGARPSPTDDTPQQSPVQYYQLTVRDHVEIREGIGMRVVTGDTLTYLFSTESKGFAGPSSAAPPPPPTRSAKLTGRLASTLFGQLGADPVIGQVPSSWGLGTRSIAPPISDTDIYVTCTGGLSLVPVDDPALIERLESPRDSWMTLTGAPVVLVDRSQDARAECDRLVFHGLRQKIMLVGSETWPLSITTPQMDAAGETFWIRQGTGGFTGPGWLTASRTADGGEASESPQRVTWSDGVDLDFDETSTASAGALGNLRQAVFRGDVEARSEDSAIACHDRLVLDLDTDAHGVTSPTLLTASGNVRANDPDQTMWSDLLVASFVRRETNADDAGADAEIDVVTAEGNVQVLMADGARAFADRLIADARRETVELTGTDVALANTQWLVDRGTSITLDKETGTARWNGPGTARMFDQVLAIGIDGRFDRDAITFDPNARATWTESMSYHDTAGSGEGAIELTGSVRMISEPDRLQRTSFGADNVTIELAGGPAEPVEAGPDDRRAIGRVIGRGNATLEQRRWVTVARSDRPRIVYISADRLEFDRQSGLALVPGPGTLLIRDLRPPSDDEADNADGFAARGTTSFKWTTRLKMTRRSETLYDIQMVDGVEMRHLDLSEQVTTLTCRRIDATVDRGADARTTDGPTDLRHVRAEGEVFLRTPTRDVDCDLFDYAVAAGLAELGAYPGRLVTIHTRGTPQPVTLRGAVWNLVTDEITAQRGSAGGTR